MIKVTAKIIVKEEVINDFLTTTSALINQTRQEDGCIAYELFKDLEAQNTFMFVEAWESKEALDAHMEVLKTTGYGDKLNEAAAEEIAVNVMALVK